MSVAQATPTQDAADALASDIKEPAANNDAKTAERDRRPIIVIEEKLAKLSKMAIEALLHANKTNLYVRAGILVRMVRVRRRRTKTCIRAVGAPSIVPVTFAYLRLLLDLAAKWVRLGSHEILIPALPPTWVCETVLDKGEWPFPPLEGVIETPTLRADGTIIDRPGYDPESGFLYLPQIDFPPTPSDPTLDDAAAAAITLLEPFRDFPFVSEDDRATCLAAVLSIAGRPAIEGPVPMFGVGSPTPGTGKGLLVRTITLITTGRDPALTTLSRREEEFRKRLLSIALQGVPVIVIDNIEGALGSPTLAAALTTVEFADRLLGVSKFVRAPLTAVWFATGNGLRFQGDVGRRVIPIDLDAKVEQPESRSGFKHSPLAEYVLRERPRLVAAALTILRAYHVAGRPKHGLPQIGSFEEWDDLIRGACIWIGVGDPAAGRSRIRDEDDDDLEAVRALYAAWLEAFGESPKTVAEAIKAAETADALHDALSAFDIRSSVAAKLDARAIGNKLKCIRGRVVNGHRLERAPSRSHNRIHWCVVPVEGAEG